MMSSRLLHGGIGSGGLATDDLGHLGGHVLADLGGGALGQGGLHVLDDGGAGNTGLDGVLDHGGGDDGVGAEEVLGVGLGLPLAVGVVAGVRDDLVVGAHGVLVSGHLLANNNILGGAVGLNVALLADHHGLGDGLADGHGDVVVGEGHVVGIAEPAEQQLGVGLRLGGGGGQGRGGEEGEAEGNLGEGVMIG